MLQAARYTYLEEQPVQDTYLQELPEQMEQEHLQQYREQNFGNRVHIACGCMQPAAAALFGA